MRIFTSCRKLAFFAGLLCIASSEMQGRSSWQQATNRHHLKVAPIYKLRNLGETDVDPAALVKNPLKPCLAPAINNLGQVIANRIEGGFLRDDQGELAPHIHDVVINFHGLNDRGDILVSYNRKNDPTEWMIWPTARGSNGLRESLKMSQEAKGELTLVGITNDRQAIGNLVVENKAQPVVWEMTKGMHHLRTAEGKLVDGAAVGVINPLEVIGYFSRGDLMAPSAWNPQEGLKFIRHYRGKIGPDAEIVQRDLTAAADGTVYGTYSIDYQKDPEKDKDVYHAYAWSPKEGGFKLLDLENMRINAVNSSHVLVGSLYGKAAICWPGQSPLAVSALVTPEDSKSWDFLAATGINDAGQVVGYGLYEGKMRIFLLDLIATGLPVINSTES